MPRIPFGIQNAELPASSGMKGGVVGTPVVQEPALDAATATVPGRALAQFGQQVQQTGDYLAQAEAYQLHREKAQTVQDSTMSSLDFLQAYQPAIAERQQSGDYKTLPQDVVKMGRDIAARVALERKLSPQAKALFQEKVETVITKAQADSLGVQSQRRQQEAIVGMGRAVEQVQARMATATDDYDRAVIVGEFKEMGNQWVAAGIIGGKEWVGIETKTFEAVSDQHIQRMTAAYPDVMKQQLFAQLRNEPTREDVPLARPEVLSQLYQQAVQASRAQFQEREHAERYADYNRKKTQEENSIPLRTSIYKTPLTPESVPTFQKIITEAATAIERGELDVDTGERIMNTAQAHGAAAGKIPARSDNPDVETTVSLAIRMAERPEDFDGARRMLTQAAEKQSLRPETFGTLYDKLEQREAAAQWREFPEVKDAKNILMRGALVPFGGTLAGQMKPKMQQQLTWATDTWEEQLQRLFDDPQGGKPAVKRQAKALAWEARRQHLQPDIDNAADAEEYLPPQVQQATTPVELAQAIHSLRMLGWSNGSLLIIRDNWHRWMESPENKLRRQGQAAPQRTPGTTSSMPKSYQLPALGTAPTGERRSN